jgi:hypothetical protein
VSSQQGQKHLRFNEQMDDVKMRAVERDFIQERLHTITSILMASMVLTISLIVLCYALFVISKRQEMMLETLLRQSGERQDTSVLSNPETRSQAGRIQDGSGK